MNEPYIMVVEDDLDARSILQMVLDTLPIRCLYAHDGVEALAFIKVLPPVLMVLDLSMPRLDGREVLRALRTDFPGVQIPIFVYTANKVDAALVGELGIPAERVLRKGDVPMAALKAMIIEVLDGQVSLSKA